MRRSTHGGKGDRGLLFVIYIVSDKIIKLKLFCYLFSILPTVEVKEHLVESAADDDRGSWLQELSHVLQEEAVSTRLLS